jgi:hypothetical protein
MPFWSRCGENLEQSFFYRQIENKKYPEKEED